MKVRTIDIVCENPDIVVLCDTDYGEIKLIWKEKPKLRCEYDIELDTNDILNWEKDIFISDIRDSKFQKEDSFTLVTGYLESVEEDGYMILRVGDNIISFLTKGNPFSIGTQITVRTRMLEAYPVYY